MTARRLPEKAFLSHAPGYWKDKHVSEGDWNSHVWQLKNRVTSPAGTTAAGLFELEQSGVRAAIIRAVEAAYRRSEALGAVYSQKGDQ